MLEYPHFGYMDLQKTGSTFVRTFLKYCIADSPVFSDKHKPAGDRYNPSKFYFITAREPISQYSSLFRFGCGSKGRLWRGLTDSGFGGLYVNDPEHFGRWLTFVTEERNAEHLKERYATVPVHLIGFQTFRFLFLAIREPMATMQKCRTRDDVRQAYEEKRIVGRVIKTEGLNDGLKDLVEGELADSVVDRNKALRFLSRPPINTSERNDALVDELDPAIRSRVVEREWFMYDVIGYDRPR